MQKLISFSIPCYRSEKTILSVINEIKQIVSKRDFEYEIVAAVDGSPDNVYSILENIAYHDKKIKVLNFSKNYGQASARLATLRYTSGDYIVCLDDDGQCPMDKLWDLIDAIEDGHDIAIADYPCKKQSNFKNFGSFLNRKMIDYLLSPPEGFRMSNFFVMKKFVVKQIIEYSNPYPYLTGLLIQSTDNFKLVKMEERDRMSGTTGYTFKKLISLWMNGFTNFSVVPLRVASFMGFVCALIGFSFGFITIIRKLMDVDIAAGYSSIIATILFIGGLLMIMMGVVGEYIGRIFLSLNGIPQYVIKDTININGEIR